MRAARVILGASLLTVTMVSSAMGQGVVSGRVTRANRPLSNAVIELIPVAAFSAPPVVSTAVIDQRHLHFVPEVLAVSPGTTVTFLNSDPNVHNVFSPGRGGAGAPAGSPAGLSGAHLEPGLEQ